MPPLSASTALYCCTERQVVPIPCSELLGSDGKVQILKEVLTRGFFDIDFRAGELVLVAGRFVGVVPLNERVIVEIRPKAKLSDFARVLEVAGEEPGSLDFFEHEYLEKDGIDRFFPLIARSLLKQLHAVEQEGILKTYRQKMGSFTFKPSVRFSKTAQRLWARGNFSHTISEVFEQTKDCPLNRLIKYALWYCGKYLGAEKVSRSLLEEVSFFYDLFESVPLDLTLQFVPEVETTLAAGQVPLIRQYYMRIAQICLLIARNRSVVLESSNGETPLLSFIINLEDVFEKYVRNTLKVYASEFVATIVQDGNTEGRSHLYYDSKAIEIRPDIVVLCDGEKKLIADVKYKPKATEADRYQIITHAVALGAHTVVSILPASEGKNGIFRKGKIRDSSGIEVFEYYLPLEGDLKAEERQMAHGILSLVADLRN